MGSFCMDWATVCVRDVYAWLAFCKWAGLAVRCTEVSPCESEAEMVPVKRREKRNEAVNLGNRKWKVEGRRDGSKRRFNDWEARRAPRSATRKVEGEG